MFVGLELRAQENNAGVGMKRQNCGKEKMIKLMEAKNTDSVGETGAESSSETDSKKSYFELQSYKTRITDILRIL